MSGTISPAVQNLINQINNIKVGSSVPIIPNGGQLGSKLTSVGKTSSKMVNNAGKFNAKDIADAVSKTSKGSGFNFWDTLSGTLGQIGGAVTDTAYHDIANIKNLVKNPSWSNAGKLLWDANPIGAISKGIVNGSKNQWKDWTDGKTTWGDVPLVGFLHGADTGWKRGTDIAKDQIGIKNPIGQTAAGIGIDILADPLTYLTGGLSAASKAGEAAKVAKMTEIAGKNGIQMTKDMIQDPHILLDAVRNQDLAKYPNLAKVIDDKYIKNADSIDNAFNTAHNANVNSWGFHIPNLPFTKTGDNLVKALGGKQNFVKAGEYGAKNPLYRNEATLGNEFAHVADNLFKTHNVPEGMKASILKNTFGVDSTKDLTKTQFSQLNDAFKSVKTPSKLPDAVSKTETLNKEMPNEIFNILTRKGIPNETVNYNKLSPADILKTLDPRVAKTIAPMLHGLGDVEDIRKLAPDATKMFGELARKISPNIKGKTAQNVEKTFGEAADKLKNTTHTGHITTEPPIKYTEAKTTAQVLKDGHPASNAMKNNRAISKAFERNKTPELMHPTTRLEKIIARKNPFDARTFRSSNDFVNSMATHHVDSMNQQFGEMSKYRKELSSLDTMKKGLKPEEERAAIYQLEGKAPNGHTTNSLNMDKVNEYVGAMKNLLGKLAKEEQHSGLLDNVMQKYFPHVRTLSEEDMKSIQETLGQSDSSSLLGKSAKNAFNQERTGFKTIADRDNVIQGISKELAKGGLSPEREASLRDALDKLGKMYNLDTSQVMLRRVRESIRSRSMKMMQGEFKKFGMLKSNPKDVPAGLKLLTPEESRRLGLGKGQHYMQPEVLDGMKRVDEMFTSKGMNSFMRVLNGVSGLFRTATTVFKPSHYLNNYLGNAAINMAAGVTMKNYGKAFNLMKKLESGAELTKDESRIMDEAFKHGVVNGGYMSDTANKFSKVGDNPDSWLNKKADQLESANKWLLDRKVAKFGKHQGESVDNRFRLANFINGLEKNNGNVKKAAEQVRTYLFNYTENTNADRHMRAVIPFWNWTKRNIPLMLKQVMENPKYIENTQRFKELFNNNAQGADYQKQAGIHVPFTDQYLNLPFPTNDLEQLAHPVSSMISSSQPLLKAPLELASNHNFFTGNPISFGNKTVQGKDLLPYALNQIGAFGNFAKPFVNNSKASQNQSTLDKIRQAMQSYFISLSQAKNNGN